MRLLLLPAALAALLLAGCVEAEETWTLDGEGGGTYALSVRWDADLWKRVGGILGAAPMRRVAGSGFPLRAAQWRDGLRGLEGVQILELEEGIDEGGMRRIALEVRFRRVEDLLRWELLAGRRISIEPPRADGDGPRVARWRMAPIERVPVLDRLAAVAEAAARAPDAAPAGPPLDPSPLARLGVEDEAAGLVAAMLRPALEQVSLRVRVVVPGRIVGAGDRASRGEGEATFAWSFSDLRAADTDRTVDLRWEVRDIDRVLPVERK